MSALIFAFELAIKLKTVIDIANTAITISRDWYLLVFVTSNGIYVLDKLSGIVYHFVNHSFRRRIAIDGLDHLRDPWNPYSIVAVHQSDDFHFDWSLMGSQIDEMFEELEDKEMTDFIIIMR